MEKDVLYGKVGGQELLLDIHRPQGTKEGRPALVMIHGGGWVGGAKEDFVQAGDIAKVGYVVFNINYRLVTPTGNKYPAQLDDVQRAVRWVRANAEKYGVDPDRIGAIGGSAGGHLAALLGTVDTRDNSDKALAPYSSRITCVVDVAGPADLTVKFPVLPDLDVESLVVGLIGKTRAEAPKAYRDASPIFHIDKKTVPFLIFHGTVDELVPIDQARWFHQALKQEGIESNLIEFEGEGHGFSKKETQDKAAQETNAFLSRHLKP